MLASDETMRFMKEYKFEEAFMAAPKAESAVRYFV
jgi:hypothetical protein